MKKFYVYESDTMGAGVAKLLFSMDISNNIELLEYDIKTISRNVEIDKTKTFLRKEKCFIVGWESFVFSYAYKGCTSSIDIVFGAHFSKNREPVSRDKSFRMFEDYDNAKLYYEFI